jgi:hypothetical protein
VRDGNWTRADWSLEEWEEAIRDLPEGDRWEFAQTERLATYGRLSNTRRKVLRSRMSTEGCALLQAWLAHRPDLADAILEVST